MLSVPPKCNPPWISEKNLNLGDGMKFSTSRPESYKQLMDNVVLSDNGANDSNKEPGLIVCKDDGETIRFQGNSNRRWKPSAPTAAWSPSISAKNPSTTCSSPPKPMVSKPCTSTTTARPAKAGCSWRRRPVIDMDEPGALTRLSLTPLPPPKAKPWPTIWPRNSRSIRPLCK